MFLFLSVSIVILRAQALCSYNLKQEKEEGKLGNYGMFRQLLMLFRIVGTFFFTVSM